MVFVYRWNSPKMYGFLPIIVLTFLLILYIVQEGSVYDPVKRIWIWRYNDGDQQLDFEVETGEFIRFRVVALQYNRIESFIHLFS